MRKPQFIARQGRKPSGLLGHIVARIMAKETADENDFALALLQLQPEDAVLEIGCGHGDTLAKAAKLVSRGLLCGVDFSPVMNRVATRRHRRLLAEKRLEFRLGSSDKLPLQTSRSTRFWLSIRSISGKHRSTISPKPGA